MQRALDLLRGLLALAAIAGLLLGVPVALVRLAGWPVDNLVAVVTDGLMSDSTRVSTVLIYGLVVIAWLAWAQIGWAILAEAVALGRGRAAGRAPIMPGLQSLACRLVAASTLVSAALATSPVPAGSLPPLASLAETYDDNFDRLSWGDDARTVDADPIHAARSGESRLTYTVSAGDTFWSLAERFLGDGLRWRELRGVNVGLAQADGSEITEATEELRAGWMLVLPADAVLPLTAADEATHGDDASPEREGEVVVDEGDHFWSIAEEILVERWGRQPTVAELTPFWAELVDENRGRLLPPHDPDLIYPRQTFQVPAWEPEPQLEPEPPQPEPPQPEPPVPEPEPEPDPPSLEQVTPPAADGLPALPDLPPGSGQDGQATTPPPPEPDREDVLGHEPAGSSPVTTVPTAPMPMPSLDAGMTAVANAPVQVPPSVTPDDAGRAGEAGEGSGGGGDAAAGIPLAVVAAAVSGLGLLAANVWRVVSRRRLQSIGARRPGTVPRFDPPAGAEALLGRSADDRMLTDLDRALRALGAGLASDAAMPDVVGVVVDATTVALLLNVAHRAPPAPFTIDEDGRVWRLDRSVDVGPGARSAEAPFPALVTIGHTDRSQLLLNLEHAGVVDVTGSPGDIVDTMATMAIELATSPMADTLEILCVGFGGELAGLERVTVVDDLDHVVRRIGAHADAVASLSAEVDLEGPAGRAAGVGGDTWTPLVVFDPVSTRDRAAKLIEAASNTSNGGVIAVVTAASGSRWSVHVAPGAVTIPLLGITRRRRNLDLGQRRDLVATIADAARPAYVEAPDLVTGIVAGTSHGPDGQGAAPPPPPWDVEVVVRVLGPLAVATIDGVAIKFLRGATGEFVAYLAHHRHGVTMEAAMEALWPNAEPKRPWINNVSSDARKGLGDDVDGNLLLPRMGGDGLYRLSPRVGSDLERFEQLVGYAATATVPAAVSALERALVLVAGPPHSGINSNWPQMEGMATNAILVVDEAARTMATLALEELDDPTRAEWAARQGLLAIPWSSELHLLRLRAATARGADGAAVEAVFQHYRTVVLGDDDQPEGASELDPRIVELYESSRRNRPVNWANDATIDLARAARHRRPPHPRSGR